MNYSKDFLKKLDLQKNKKIYARVTSLTLEELPLEILEGRITSGSINVDGQSAVRRTCQLSFVVPKDEAKISNYLWGLDTKFKLEIGVENTVDSNYEQIIWFKQGIYIITSFSQALSTNNFTINISGKDKMCMLNGENGGTLTSSVDFGTYQEIDKDGNTKIISYPLQDIIREAVYTYGGEQFHNIVINDLEDKGLELQEYKYDKPLYLWRRVEKDANGKDVPQQFYENGSFDEEITVYREDNGDDNKISDEEVEFESLVDLGESATTAVYTFSNEQNSPRYLLTKISYGQTVGYTETDLTYTGELIGAPGEALTSVLDKIKNMLGDFEYFYDLDGRFVFQKKKNYINTSWSPIDNDNKVNNATVYTSSTSYNFSGNELITAFNNTPNLANLKNDYAVWGSRKGATGKDIPIHIRFAIDEKPTKYTTISVEEGDLKKYNDTFGLNVKPQSSVTYDVSKGAEWREIIYQMARDYLKYNHLDDFVMRVADANKDLYPTGITGYEHYYVDMQEFWRQIYDPENPEWKDGWNPQVRQEPEMLKFWFDFLDTSGELGKYSVKAVGLRQKVQNDSAVRAIAYRETPGIIFYSGTKPTDDENTGYRYFNVGQYKNMFSQSTQGKSALNALDTLLYNHSYCIESVSITAIPVYYLEPNTNIYVNDYETGISGEYNLSKISYQLTYNGTMSLTATKVVNRLM